MDRSMARSTLYNTLSLFFTYPDEKAFPWIMEGKWMGEMKGSLGLLTEENFEKYFESFENGLSGEKTEVSLEVAREYTRLFINGFPSVVAPPYGSVYLEKEGLVFGKTTSEVLRFYHEAGVTLKEDISDPPDHVAHELEFMGILTGQEAQATGAERVKLEEVQIDFLSRFILPWVPGFCERIRKQSRSTFYQTLASLTREFIHLEKNYLGIPEELNFQKSMESEIRGG